MNCVGKYAKSKILYPQSGRVGGEAINSNLYM